MKHSAIQINGNIMSFIAAPEKMPAKSGGDGIKDYLFWQQSMKIYDVKEKDKAEIMEYINSNEIATENYGFPIPFQLMEIYKAEDGKEYARKNNKVLFNSVNQIVGINKTCPVCKSTYSVGLAEKEDALPYCDDCNRALVAVITEKRANKISDYTTISVPHDAMNEAFAPKVLPSKGKTKTVKTEENDSSTERAD